MSATAMSPVRAARRDRQMPKLDTPRVPEGPMQDADRLPKLPVEIVENGVVIDTIYLPDPREEFVKRYKEVTGYIMPLAGLSARPKLSYPMLS